MKKLILYTTITLVNLLAPVLNLNGQNIYAFAGTGTVGFSGDGGPAISAQLNAPYRTALDASGSLIISDFLNHRIRKVNSSGIITTIAGSTQGYSGDGGSATLAQFNAPSGVAIDLSGNIYVTDYGNNVVRMINTSGIISTIVGNGTAGFSGDGGNATLATLTNPYGITIDATGNLYIADTYNSRIRKITPSGTITTIAGTNSVGFSGDGGLGVNASLNLPQEVAVDLSGNIYIADSQNHRIRKINTSGVISTIAGNGVNGFSGDGSPATSAQLDTPVGVSIDGSGNIYIADLVNQRIRKINSLGIISTIAGNGTIGNSGDGGAANLCQFSYPSGVTTDGLGNLFICDASNDRVREICVGTCLANIASFNKDGNFVFTYPNPVSNILNIASEQYFRDGTEIEITNYLGQTVLKSIFKNEIDVSLISQGCYILKILTCDKQQFHSKFIKE